MRLQGRNTVVADRGLLIAARMIDALNIAGFGKAFGLEWRNDWRYGIPVSLGECIHTLKVVCWNSLIFPALTKSQRLYT